MQNTAHTHVPRQLSDGAAQRLPAVRLVRRQPEGAADTEIYFSVGRPRYTAVKEKKQDSGREHIHDGRVQETLEVSCDWTEPVCITNMPEACWNPVLLVQHEHVLLFFKTGNKIADWKTMVMLSRTDPVYWGHPRPLVPGDSTGGRGPVRTKPILLPSGRICAGGALSGASGSASVITAIITASPGTVPRYWG